MPVAKRLLLNKKELSALLGVTPITIDNWRERGIIPEPDCRFPTRCVWTVPSLRTWLESQGEDMTEIFAQFELIILALE